MAPLFLEDVVLIDSTSNKPSRISPPKLNVGPDRVYRPKTVEEAEDVRAMAQRKPDLIKVWIDDNLHTLPEPRPKVVGAAIEEAHKQDLRVAAHLFYQKDAKWLLADKIDILGHSIRDEAVSNQTIQAIKRQKVYYIPTLELEESFFVYEDQPEWMKSEFFKQAADPALLEMLNSDAYRSKVQEDKTTLAHKAEFQMAMKNLKKLHSADVMVAFGTDSGATPMRVQGLQSIVNWNPC